MNSLLRWASIGFLLLCMGLPVSSATTAQSKTLTETPTATPDRTPRPTATPSPIPNYPPRVDMFISYNGEEGKSLPHTNIEVKYGDRVKITIHASDPEYQPVSFQTFAIPFDGIPIVEELPDKNEAILTISFDVPQRACSAFHQMEFRVASTPFAYFFNKWIFITDYNSDNADNDEILIGQGLGGTLSLQIRNTDPERGRLSSITQSFRTVSEAFAAQIGGEGRGVRVLPGDINGDGINDLVISFGPVEATAEVPLPNIIVPRDGRTREIIGNCFMAFPKGNTKAIHYNLGDIHTAVGNFTGTAPLQIAAAQGLGGNGVVRLFQYTGEPAPNAYKIIGQFDGLAGKAKTNNANGGINLAAGDVDGDGLDELIVGQTYSETSQSIFHILDIDSNGRIANRTGCVAFSASYRSRGAGVCVTVGDMNGDGINEVIAGGQIPSSSTDVNVSYISILHWNSETEKLVGFENPKWQALSVFSANNNPSGILSLSAGEFNNCDLDGEELVMGTGSLLEIKNGLIIHSLPAPQSLVTVKKVLFDTDQKPSFVFSILLRGYLDSLPAFLSPYNPTSGAVHVAAGKMH